MDENLVGYLLQALDPQTHEEVEAYLRSHPEAQQHLARLRRALEPLAADQEETDAPSGLWIRTLGRVAEYQCRNLPQAPLPSASQVGTASRSRWRRADLLVAAAVLLLATGLGLAGLGRVWHSYQITACQNNLSGLHRVLWTYAIHNNQELPDSGKSPVGMVVPILNDAQAFPPDVSLTCPANGNRATSRLSVQELEELQARNPTAFQNTVRGLMGCYAYSLGYRQPDAEGTDHLYRPRLGIDDEEMPIMADRPPFDASYQILAGNSPNHGRDGQNVLFLGGNVKFLPSRRLGTDDDVYLNRNRQVGAGLGRDDVVLGAGWACP